MTLSVVIVNYNVKYFLEQCLHATLKATANIDAEIFVVDNNSVDGSCNMVREKFPSVILIENKENTGFSKANNQAIRISKGEYVLLLNPDTVIQEDTFKKCIAFMDSNPQAGALGVKMIDGKGNFLPESKRGLPTPLVAFYKIFGLSTLFPFSKTFGKYHLGFLDKDKNHEVEILAGAYMFMRKSVLDKVGLLDESFFMYGEDIDLSYRILKAGYKNYYLADTTIIHYKGESTKKGSINYVLVFYNAMQIFARKHFSQKNAMLYTLLINIAIWLRATISIFTRFSKTLFLPFADALIIFAGFYFIKPLWEHFKFGGNYEYPREFLYYILPSYILIWITSILFTGAYEKPIKLSALNKGLFSGSIIILAIYALLPLEMRFSRALIIIGAIWSFVSLNSFRILLHYLNLPGCKLNKLVKKRIVIIGDEQEAARVTQLLAQTHLSPNILGIVSPTETNDSVGNIGNISQLEDIIRIYKAEEIIFCAKDVPSQEIINYMLKLSSNDIEYKIAPPESLSVIGSNSINTAGDLYLINLNSVTKPTNKRFKRLVDIISSLVIISILPILILIIHNKLRAIKNIVNVLIGRYTWVGYYKSNEIQFGELPKLKPGILSPVDGLAYSIPEELKYKLNFLYAKDYKIANDVNIIIKGLGYIGREVKGKEQGTKNKE